MEHGTHDGTGSTAGGRARGTDVPRATASRAPDEPAGSIPGVPGDEALLLALDHVGLAVPDLDAALAFHTGVLGMELVHEEVNEEQGVREAMLAVGDASPGAPRVQLLAPLTPTSTIARYLDRRGPGLQQVAYRVADVDAAADVLRGRGLRLLYDAGRRGTAGSRVNFVHPADAGGVLVELVEPAPTPAG
ncbi:methylmalonyl-CoA epimerase [Pseudokineococcus basanitobsidens]|uniref:Methylmalonyl-CoA epimerase n=1 Tax=Pseudokineococcus basanitobsidens TaxID=1926649 RepID=A0ABU8RIF8_9ACTN